MSIAQAQHWLKSVVSGQPIHRDDLGVEDSSSGSLRGISPASLELAPQLQRELSQELAAAPKPELKINAPSLGIGGAQPGGMNNRSPKPPSGNTNKDKKD